MFCCFVFASNEQLDRPTCSVATTQPLATCSDGACARVEAPHATAARSRNVTSLQCSLDHTSVRALADQQCMLLTWNSLVGTAPLPAAPRRHCVWLHASRTRADRPWCVWSTTHLMVLRCPLHARATSTLRCLRTFGVHVCDSRQHGFGFDLALPTVCPALHAKCGSRHAVVARRSS